MIDERRLRILETQVDALRTREKDSETRKTYDEVFDHAALLTIADLITDGVISTLDYPVSTGKEANVFHATGPDGRAKAVKIYRIANATFRTIRKAKLVHADMSEYNLLWWGGRVVVIDVGQAVPLDHPRAAEWFKRDVGNIARFFRRLRVDVTPAGLERAVLGG